MSSSLATTGTIEQNATFDQNTLQLELIGRMSSDAVVTSSCSITWSVEARGTMGSTPETVTVTVTAEDTLATAVGMNERHSSATVELNSLTSIKHDI